MTACLKRHKPTVYKGYSSLVNAKRILGAIITYYRLKVGLTQYQLADLIGCSQVTCLRMETEIKNIESFFRSVRLTKLEAVFDVPPGMIQQRFEDIYLTPILQTKYNRIELFKVIVNLIENIDRTSLISLHSGV